MLVISLFVLFSSTTAYAGGPCPINWKTDTITVSADEFYIVANGSYYIPNAALKLTSDPGNEQYTTLEASWLDGTKEMRLNLYFAADENHWWVSEVRTYNGNTPGDWIYYSDNKIQAPIGSQFKKHGEYTLDCQFGQVYFKNLKIKVNLNKPVKETIVEPCTELLLEKGTFLRATNVAFLTKDPNPNSPKYTTIFTGTDQLIYITKNTQAYLTYGGFIAKETNLTKYLEKLSRMGINIKTIHVE